MDDLDDRLRQRVMMWSDRLMDKYPFVPREASLRAIEYAVTVNQLNPGGFAALRKEEARECRRLHAVMADAIVFCEIYSSLPLLARFVGPDGTLPAAVENLLEMDDRTHSMVVKTLLARGVNARRWLTAMQGDATDEGARRYVIAALEDAHLTDLTAEAYVDSGWASRFFPRESGSGQTLKYGSRKEWRR